MALIARGAKRQKSGATSDLQPFRPLLLSWRGRGELPTVTCAEPAGDPVHLTGEWLYSGFYINEITLRIISRHDPDPELFAAYTIVLRELADKDLPERALRIYEKRLLQSAGYGMVLTHPANDTEQLSADRYYYYVADFGPLEEPPSGTAVKVSGRTLLALEAEDLRDAEVLREAKRLMRYVLQPHLGSRPLMSRELFRHHSTDRTAVNR